MGKTFGVGLLFVDTVYYYMKRTHTHSLSACMLLMPAYRPIIIYVAAYRQTSTAGLRYAFRLSKHIVIVR